jgi:hypothetical protein
MLRGPDGTDTYSQPLNIHLTAIRQSPSASLATVTTQQLSAPSNLDPITTSSSATSTQQPLLPETYPLRPRILLLQLSICSCDLHSNCNNQPIRFSLLNSIFKVARFQSHPLLLFSGPVLPRFFQPFRLQLKNLPQKNRHRLMTLRLLPLQTKIRPGILLIALLFTI